MLVSLVVKIKIVMGKKNESILCKKKKIFLITVNSPRCQAFFGLPINFSNLMGNNRSCLSFFLNNQFERTHLNKKKQVVISWTI